MAAQLSKGLAALAFVLASPAALACVQCYGGNVCAPSSPGFVHCRIRCYGEGSCFCVHGGPMCTDYGAKPGSVFASDVDEAGAMIWLGGAIRGATLLHMPLYPREAVRLKLAGTVSSTLSERRSSPCRVERRGDNATIVSCGAVEDWPSPRSALRFTVDPSILLQIAEVDSTLAHAVLNVVRTAQDSGLPPEGFEMVFPMLDRQDVRRLIMGVRVPPPRRPPIDVRFRVATSAERSGAADRVEIAVMPLDRPMLQGVVLVLDRRTSLDFTLSAWRIE